MNEDVLTAIIMLNIIALVLASSLAPLGFLVWGIFILWEVLVIIIVNKYKSTNLKLKEANLYY